MSDSKDHNDNGTVPTVDRNVCPAGKILCVEFDPEYPDQCWATRKDGERVCTDIADMDECPHVVYQKKPTVSSIPDVPPVPPEKKPDTQVHVCPAGTVQCKRSSAAGWCMGRRERANLDVNECDVCPRPTLQEIVSTEEVGQRTISIAQCAQHPNSMPILFTRGGDIVVGPYCGQCLDAQLGAVLTKLDIKEL